MMSVFQTVCARCGSLYSCRPCQRVHSQSSPYQSWSQVTGAIPVVKLPPRNYLGLCHIDHFRNGQVSERLLYIEAWDPVVSMGFHLTNVTASVKGKPDRNRHIRHDLCLGYSPYTNTNIYICISNII